MVNEKQVGFKTFKEVSQGGKLKGRQSWWAKQGTQKKGREGYFGKVGGIEKTSQMSNPTTSNHKTVSDSVVHHILC